MQIPRFAATTPKRRPSVIFEINWMDTPMIVSSTANSLHEWGPPANGRASNDRHVAEKARAQSVGLRDRFLAWRRKRTMNTMSVSVNSNIKSEIATDCPKRSDVPIATANAWEKKPNRHKITRRSKRSSTRDLMLASDHQVLQASEHAKVGSSVDGFRVCMNFRRGTQTH